MLFRHSSPRGFNLPLPPFFLFFYTSLPFSLIFLPIFTPSFSPIFHALASVKEESWLWSMQSILFPPPPPLPTLPLQHSFHFSFSFIDDLLRLPLTPLTLACWSLFQRQVDGRIVPPIKHHLNASGLERQIVAVDSQGKKIKHNVKEKVSKQTNNVMSKVRNTFALRAQCSY